MADDDKDKKIVNFEAEQRKKLQEEREKYAKKNKDKVEYVDDPHQFIDFENVKKKTDNSIAERKRQEDVDLMLKNLNEDYAFIKHYAGSPAIMCRKYNPILKQDDWAFIDIGDFHKLLVNKFMYGVTDKGKQSVTKQSQWWLINQYRRTYDIVMFNPKREPGEYEVKGKLRLEPDSFEAGSKSVKLVQEYEKYFNTYMGFKYKAEKGDVKLFLKHLYVVMANKNPEYFRYIFYWLAWSIQNIGTPAGVALIFKGKKGAGKGVICQALVDIFGVHGMTLSNSEYLTGKHNDHLARCIFMFADEAYYPGEKQTDGILKSLITEPTILVQPKFRSTYTERNCLHIVMATNNDWVIPATHDERRYFIVEVSDKYTTTGSHAHLKKQYFDPLWKSLDEKGKSAILYMLQNFKLPEYWRPLDKVPETKELLNQMEKTLTGAKYAIMSMLEAGSFPGIKESTGYIISSKGLVEYLMSQEPGLKISAKAVASVVKQLGATPNPNRAEKRGWIFPSLSAMRKIWNREILKKDWNLDEEWAESKEGF